MLPDGEQLLRTALSPTNVNGNSLVFETSLATDVAISVKYR
jgi:hypothetical protein